LRFAKSISLFYITDREVAMTLIARPHVIGLPTIRIRLKFKKPKPRYISPLLLILTMWILLFWSGILVFPIIGVLLLVRPLQHNIQKILLIGSIEKLNWEAQWWRGNHRYHINLCANNLRIVLLYKAGLIGFGLYNIISFSLYPSTTRLAIVISYLMVVSSTTSVIAIYIFCVTSENLWRKK
jgi:hypothetical protein